MLQSPWREVIRKAAIKRNWITSVLIGMTLLGFLTECHVEVPDLAREFPMGAPRNRIESRLEEIKNDRRFICRFSFDTASNQLNAMISETQGWKIMTNGRHFSFAFDSAGNLVSKKSVIVNTGP
jgi:hypothetical protein